MCGRPSDADVSLAERGLSALDIAGELLLGLWKHPSCGQVHFDFDDCEANLDINTPPTGGRSLQPDPGFAEVNVAVQK